MSGANDSYASLCLDKYPQNLQLPDQLKDVTAELEGADLEERVAMAPKFLNLDE